MNAVEYDNKVTAAAAIIPKIGTKIIFNRLIKAAIVQILPIIFVFFSKIIKFIIIPKAPNNKELNATKGVTRKPFNAICEVVNIINIGFDKNVKINNEGIAIKRKYFNE